MSCRTSPTACRHRQRLDNRRSRASPVRSVRRCRPARWKISGRSPVDSPRRLAPIPGADSYIGMLAGAGRSRGAYRASSPCGTHRVLELAGCKNRRLTHQAESVGHGRPFLQRQPAWGRRDVGITASASLIRLVDSRLVLTSAGHCRNRRDHAPDAPGQIACSHPATAINGRRGNVRTAGSAAPSHPGDLGLWFLHPGPSCPRAESSSRCRKRPAWKPLHQADSRSNLTSARSGRAPTLGSTVAFRRVPRRGWRGCWRDVEPEGWRW